MNTTLETGEQWDAPNGFAAVQWVAVRALRRHHRDDLAREVAHRWLSTVSRMYTGHGRLFEKYDVKRSDAGGGGGYPLQSGQGWTASISVALLAEYPEFAQFGAVTPIACESSEVRDDISALRTQRPQ